MKTQKALLGLSGLIAALALIAAGTGVLWQQGGTPFTMTSVRGQTVEIWGHGLYRFDAVGTAVGVGEDLSRDGHALPPRQQRALFAVG